MNLFLKHIQRFHMTISFSKTDKEFKIKELHLHGGIEKARSPTESPRLSNKGSHSVRFPWWSKSDPSSPPLQPSQSRCSTKPLSWLSWRERYPKKNLPFRTLSQHEKEREKTCQYTIKDSFFGRKSTWIAAWEPTQTTGSSRLLHPSGVQHRSLRR